MTRKPSPVTPPVVLTIAGSDSGGGAGIQADLKTIEAGGGFATSAVTSVTAQHSRGVESTHVLSPAAVRAQCEAVRSDYEVRAVKTGMLATTEIVTTVTEQVSEAAAPVVVDPVMVAASGDRLLDRDAESAYEELVAAATLVTPNADEATVLTGVEVTDADSAAEAADRLVGMGADAALVTGGHLPGDDVVNAFVSAAGTETITTPRVATDATHGSGCALSAAIATRLAHGDELPEAVRAGVDLLGRAVRYSLDVGEGPGTVHHLVSLRNRAERDPTAERVERVLRRLVEADVSRLVPEVGMNVVGATPYAESPAECAAVEGRITRTLDGVEPARGVRFGASSHVARFLLAAREFETDLRFAVNCRFDEGVREALDALAWPVGSYDRGDQPEAVEATDGRTMQWGVREALAGRDEPPVAVTDPGAVGKEPMVKLLATDADGLFTRVERLLDRVE